MFAVAWRGEWIGLVLTPAAPTCACRLGYGGRAVTARSGPISDPDKAWSTPGSGLNIHHKSVVLPQAQRTRACRQRRSGRDVVCLDDHGRPQFNNLAISPGYPVTFIAFDLLFNNGTVPL